MNDQKLLEALGWLNCTEGIWCSTHDAYKPTGWQFCEVLTDGLDYAEQGYDLAIKQMKNSLVKELSKIHLHQVESLDEATTADRVKNILGILTGITWSQNIVKDWKENE